MSEMSDTRRAATRLRARDRRFVVALIVCVGLGWQLVPAATARGMLVGALASVLTWWAVTAR